MPKKLKTNAIHAGHNILILTNQFPDESVDLIYLDPPFFSGSNYDIVWGNGTEMNAYDDAGMYWQSQEVDEETLNAEFERMLKVIDPDNTLDEDAQLDLKSKLRREKQGRISQGDIAGYIHYMSPILRELHRVLKPIGTIYLHCDHHANAHLRILLDEIFGERNFRDEIIWSYTKIGGTKKKLLKWHETIFRYTKTKDFIFNMDEIRVPYSESTLSSLKEDERGHYYTRGLGTNSSIKRFKKTYIHPKGRVPSDVWHLGDYSPSSKERLGYPTQKPEILLERIILASSNKGDVVLDPFVGGGTTCVVAHRLGRKYIGIDISPRACAMTVRNFERYGVTIDYDELNFDYPKVITTMELMSKLGEMDEHKYETWVRNALNFKDKKRSHSIGVDGIKYMKKKLAGKRVFEEFLEVKKWKGKVGRRTVSKLVGDMQAHGVRRGTIVANQFTRDARRRIEVLAKEGIHVKLRLIDDVIEKNEELMRDPTLIDFYIEEESD